MGAVIGIGIGAVKRAAFIESSTMVPAEGDPRVTPLTCSTSMFRDQIQHEFVVAQRKQCRRQGGLQFRLQSM